MNSINKNDEEHIYVHSVPIHGVFFDNDDVLYKAPDNQDDFHKLAAVRAVQDQCPDMGTRQLARLLEKGKEKGKGSLDIFVERFDADADLLRADHYKHLIKLTEEFPSFFGEEESLYAEIAKLKIAGVSTHIITHGNPEWTEFTTDRGERKISDFFKNRNYTTKDEMPNHRGKGTKEIYDRALDKMCVDSDQELRGLGFAMVEDTMKNLKAAKEHGMMTIFINRKGLPADQIADYVDLTVNSSKEAVSAIFMNNNAHEKMPLCGLPAPEV